MISVHADPRTVYPWYTGYADEKGAGRGEGYNLNLVVPEHSGDGPYLEAVRTGIDAARKFGADFLVLALGLDASENDPFASMKVTTEGFRRMGEMLGGLRIPTVIEQEGGYPSPILGRNLIAFIEGFRGAAL